jgi:uncharacterized protein with HEPN domain
MSKSDRLHLYLFEDILNAISKVEAYVFGTTIEEFRKNPMMIDAVIRNFEIIGEAANKIPDILKNEYPDVEWRQMIGFRNVLIHDYFEIDVESVWDTIA